MGGSRSETHVVPEGVSPGLTVDRFQLREGLDGYPKVNLAANNRCRLVGKHGDRCSSCFVNE